MHTADMILKHPDVRGSDSRRLLACIDECLACAQACLSCADACIAEDMVQSLRQCIRLNLDCADMCEVTAKLASRRTGTNEGLLATMLEACEMACSDCAMECERHAHHHDHCRVCAEACRACEAACRRARQDVTPRSWN